MTSRIQTQRLSTTGTRPANGARPPGELWLNFPDFRLGMVDPTKAPVDLLPIRVYASTATYAQGDFVVNAGQLLQARLALAPKAFAITDWNQLQSIAQTDTRYLALNGGTLTGGLTLSPASGDIFLTLNRVKGQSAVLMGETSGVPRWMLIIGNSDAESGANAGSNFVLNRFSDTGAYNGMVLTINRATGVVDFGSSPTVNGGAALPYLPIAGGTLTGQLGVGGNGISYPSLGGTWAAHHTAIAWDGSNLQVAADGSYIGAAALQSWVTANYLNRAGGTLSGALTVGGNGITYAVATNKGAMAFGWDGAEVQAWVNGTYVGNLATQALVGNYLPLAGGVTSGTVRVGNGRLMSSNAGGNPSVTAWDTSGGNAVGFWDTGGQLAFGGMDGSGAPVVEWGYFSGGNFGCVGNLSVANGGMAMTVVGGNCTLFFTNWYLQFQSGNGNLVWADYLSRALFYCDNSGSLHASLDVTAGRNVAANQVIAQGGSYALNGDMGLYAGGSGRVIQFASGDYFDWNTGNGNLHWVQGGAVVFEFRVTDGFSGNDRGAVYGYGAYTNLSDERAKTNVQPSPYGLPEILQLNPIAFERTNVVSVRREHGFSAQQVQPIIPEAVVAVTQDSDPLLGINIDPIVAALVNATKDLHHRLRILEGDHHA